MSTSHGRAPSAVWSADPVATFGKVAGALAGAGVFLYVIGVVVLWQRLGRQGLQAQEVIAGIPRDQVAVAGAREALFSSIAGALGAAFLYVSYRSFRSSQRVSASDGLHARLARRMRERPASTLTIAIAACCALIGPISLADVVLLLAFLGVLFFGVRSAHRSLIGESLDFRTSPIPWLRVAAGLAAGVFIVSVARQIQFPDRLALATVELENQPGVLCGLYVGATSDAIAIGQPTGYLKSYFTASDSCDAVASSRPTTVFVARNRIKRLNLTYPANPPAPPASSLLHLIGIPIECIAPVCRIGSTRLSLQELLTPARDAKASTIR